MSTPGWQQIDTLNIGWSMMLQFREVVPTAVHSLACRSRVGCPCHALEMLLAGVCWPVATWLAGGKTSGGWQNLRLAEYALLATT